ncbi:hypothetical protein LTR16_010128, partial [Cryomyces antarcticus]
SARPETTPAPRAPNRRSGRCPSSSRTRSHSRSTTQRTTRLLHITIRRTISRSCRITGTTRSPPMQGSDAL